MLRPRRPGRARGPRPVADDHGGGARHPRPLAAHADSICGQGPHQARGAAARRRAPRPDAVHAHERPAGPDGPGLPGPGRPQEDARPLGGVRARLLVGARLGRAPDAGGPGRRRRLPVGGRRGVPRGLRLLPRPPQGGLPPGGPPGLLCHGWRPLAHGGLPRGQPRGLRARAGGLRGQRRGHALSGRGGGKPRRTRALSRAGDAGAKRARACSEGGIGTRRAPERTPARRLCKSLPGGGHSNAPGWARGTAARAIGLRLCQHEAGSDTSPAPACSSSGRGTMCTCPQAVQWLSVRVREPLAAHCRRCLSRGAAPPSRGRPPPL
mmetsp:Transcript_22818/g.76631  ORF Transcript_22818/g.76631 Transcript_22818/m.76631 type:complete len:323 (+) Transcript_22818:482-1450(+)